MDPGVTTLMLRPLLLLMLNYPERFGSASGRMIPERILRFRIRFTDLLIMHHVKIFQLKISCVKQKHVRFPVCVFFLNRFFIAAGYILRVQGPYPMPAICKEFNNTKQQIQYIPSPVPPPPFPFSTFSLTGGKNSLLLSS